VRTNRVGEIEEHASAEHIRRERHAQQPALAARGNQTAQIGKRRALQLPIAQHFHQPVLLDDVEDVGKIRIGHERHRLGQAGRDHLRAQLGG
jgi:hypothetical protein